MYELYIKEITGIDQSTGQPVTGEWLLADLGDEQPAMVYQANDIAELKDRQSSYSQSLKLPISPANTRIFRHADLFDVRSDVRYALMECRLYSNGCILAGKGSKLKLRQVSEHYECQILSGNQDFFETLKNKPFSELDLGYMARGIEYMPGHTEAYQYLAASFVAGRDKVEMSEEHSYPFIQLKYVLDQVIYQALGRPYFTFKTNLDLEDYQKKYLSLSGIKGSEGSLNSLAYEIIFSADTRTMIIEKNPGAIITNVPNRSHEIKFRSPLDCTCELQVRLITSAEINGNFRLESDTNTENKTEISWSDGYPYKKSKILKLSKNECLTIRFDTGRIIGKPKLAIEFMNFVSTQEKYDVPLGGQLYFAPNLSFKTCLDFFKAFVQLYGLTVVVDNTNRIVYAYTMKKVYENKSIARDWSDKLDMSTPPEAGFSFNSYAQENHIKLKENKKSGFVDTATFKVQNTSLDQSKDLFTIGFESGTNFLTIDKSTKIIQEVAHIPLEEADPETGERNIKGTDTHIVSRFDGFNKLIIKSLKFEKEVDVYFAYHQPITNYLANYYQELSSQMLFNARVIEAYFNLKDQDIEEFNHDFRDVEKNFGQLIPIYLKQFGAYFYLNKISNFISGKLTKCELIKL